MDGSPPGSPVHGILQARILEWVGLFSLKIDLFDILAVQETYRSLQHHSSKASTVIYNK